MSLLKRIFFFVLLNTGSSCFAQLLDSASLAEQKVYRSLQEALQNPNQVYRLDLKRKKLKTVPPEIFQFKNLQELVLSKNHLKELPEAIGTLSHLQLLDVSINKLETFPDSIGKLKHLKKIAAFKNNIAVLPRSMSSLENLEVLDLWSNDISVFPEEMNQLKKLKKLDLRVILLNDEDQDRIRKLFPDTKIFFSPSCKCVTG